LQERSRETPASRGDAGVVLPGAACLSPFTPNSAIGFGQISQRLRAGAHWTLPRRTLWCVEHKEQCADAEGFAKGIPNAIAEFGLNRSFHFAHSLLHEKQLLRGQVSFESVD
jgi:hypothetical protein